MELRQLRYTVAVADSSSISGAASKLFIAQSALSLQISHLEDELGVKLFHRSRSGVTATERGHVFLRHARSILQQVRDTEHAMHAQPDAPSGEVALAIPQSVSAALALPLMRACIDQLPRVRLRLTEELSGHVADQVRTGKISMGVMFDEDNLDSFDWVPLACERLCAVGSPALISSGPDAMPLGSLMSLPLILPTEGHGVRAQVDALARDIGFQSMNVIAEITSISVLESMLIAGMGVTVQARMPMAAAIARGELVARELTSPPVVRRVALCRSRSSGPTEAARAVWHLVATTVRSLCERGVWMGAEVEGAEQ